MKVARDYPGAYMVSGGFRFNEYKGEPVIIVDHFRPENTDMGSNLEILTRSEITTIVVTSNFHPSQVWGDDPKMNDLILSRFRVVEFGREESGDENA